MDQEPQQIQVSSPDELEAKVNSYIAQEFTIQNRTADRVMLSKTTEIWALPIEDRAKLVLGLMCCIVPGYLYAKQLEKKRYQAVEIVLV